MLKMIVKQNVVNESLGILVTILLGYHDFFIFLNYPHDHMHTILM